jgi:DNA-binding CsgD family transcriptional regulator
MGDRVVDEQLITVRSRFEEAAGGRGAVIVIDGDPGTGRTSVLDRLAEIARQGGLRTVAIRTSPRDSEVPFAMVGILGEELDTKARGVSATAEDIAEVAARIVEAASANDDGPGACLLVDDAQWADEASLRTLIQVTARIRDRSVAIVLATGPDAASPVVPALLDDLRSASPTTLVQLDALSRAAADELIDATLGAVAPAERDALWDRSGGNPFLLTELVAAPDAAGVPPRVRAAVAARVGRLGADAVSVARAVHVLGPEATLGRCAELAELDRRPAEDAADALVRAGVLRFGAVLVFAQPLVGEAIGHDLDGFVSDRVHRAAARLLVADGLPAERVVPHLLRTTPTGEAWVVDQLREVASGLLDAGDCATAAELLRRAVDEPPLAVDRPGILSELAFAESRAGLPTAAARIDDALAAVTTADDRLMLLRERTRLMWLTGRLPEAVEASETALAEAPAGSDLHDQLLAELLAVASMHDLAPIYARPALVALLDKAGGGWVPDSAPLAATLATVLPFVLGDLRLVGPLVDRAMLEDIWRVDAPPFGMRPDFVIGSLWLSDGLERGTEIIHTGMTVVDPANLFRHGLLHYWLGEIRYAAGDLPGAIEAATMALAPEWGPFLSWLGFSTATLAHAYLDLDDLVQASQVLDSTVGRMDPAQLTGIAVDLARARLLLRQDRPNQARLLTDQVSAGLGVLGHRDGPQIVWRPIAACAAAGDGDAGTALALLDEEIELARATHAMGRLGRALRTKAKVGDPSGRLALLRQSVEVLVTSERELERARSLLWLGLGLHESGDTAGARTVLTEARELAEQCGSPPTANAALNGLHATGARPRRSARAGLDSLTGSERRVVEAAASGRTNREIGEELDIAPRTVEWHLGRAFAKLGVESRRDLSAALQRRS